MALSRLRLRLGVWFAVAYLAGLLLLDLSLYGYLRLQAYRRFVREVNARGDALVDAVLQELQDAPEAGLAGAAREAMREWQAPPGAYLVLDSTLRTLAAEGPPEWLAAAAQPGAIAGEWDVVVRPGVHVREAMVLHDHGPRFSVVVMASAHGFEEYNEALAWWLTISAVLVLLLGLVGGYVLSRRALAPIDELGDAIARISPTALGARLAVNAPADEVDRVRQQFNALLERVEGVQAQNRRFLREAAHQIRTPLTLVMGEASLGLPRAEGATAEALRRIQLAAEQMQRRVDDLFLIAEAQAGAPPALDPGVDLDGVLLEVADAMRGRAHHLGRQLAFGEVAPATVRGHRGLLREALLELVENAIRHGSADRPVELTLQAAAEITIVIASGGAPFTTASGPADPVVEGSDHGLGLQIVHWIARLHGGRLTVASADGGNRVALVLPAGPT